MSAPGRSPSAAPSAPGVQGGPVGAGHAAPGASRPPTLPAVSSLPDARQGVRPSACRAVRRAVRQAAVRRAARLAAHRMALPAALLFALASASACAQSAIEPRNTRHALVIGIGHYSDPRIPVLRGVERDMASVRQLTRAMAIPDANVSVLRDGQASAERIRAAIRALDAKVRDGDRVFVYYSGHGTRWYDPSIKDDGCTEGLLAADGQALTNVELARALAPMARRADKMMVFYDACFSGGVAGSAGASTTVRSTLRETITPKFTLAGAPAACAKPSNLRTRSLERALEQRHVLPGNVVHVAASRPDEVSFDSDLTGGHATAAWRDCMLGEARDSDGSGGVTAAEILACAQAKVDRRLAGYPDITGQHLVLAGNAAFVPARIAAAFAPIAPIAPLTAAAPPAAAPPGAAVPPAAVPPATLPPAAAAAASPASTTAATATAAPGIAAPPDAAARPTPPGAAAPALASLSAAPVPAPASVAALGRVPAAQAIAAPALPLPASAALRPSLPAAPAVPAPSATPTAALPTAMASAAAPPLPAPSSAALPPRLARPAALLVELHAQRDATRQVALMPARKRLRIGVDTLALTLTSARDGWLYLALAGSDDKSLYLLYPNTLASDNRVRAGQALELPGSGWEIVAAGPAGTETLLAIVTDAPRDLTALPATPAGPFMRALLDAQGRARLQALLAEGEPAAGCGSPGAPSCSEAFGSALLRVHAVR